jgi:hypothetical protein
MATVVGVESVTGEFPSAVLSKADSLESLLDGRDPNHGSDVASISLCRGPRALQRV